MRFPKTLSLQDITVALLFANQPKPVSVQSDTPLGSRHYEIQLENGVIAILEELPVRTAEDIRHIQTVFSLREKHPQLQLPNGAQSLTQSLDVPALVFPVPTGVHGMRLPVQQLIPLLGQAQRQFHKLTHPTRGTLASGGTFIPREDSWADEVYGLAQRRLAETIRCSAPFSDLAEKLVQIVEDNAESLNANTAGCLVHGAMGPHRVWFDPTGSPTAITGWQSACFGDVEQDWAPYLFAPRLDLFFSGYGQIEVKARFEDPASMGRLKAHTAMMLLRRLIRLTETPIGIRRADRAEQFRAMVKTFITPNWVETQVRQALNNTEVTWTPPANSTVATTRWALEAFAIAPDSSRFAYLLGALGATELAEHHPPHHQGALRVAHKACGLLPTGNFSQAFDAPVDFAAKIKTWANRIVHDYAQSERVWGQTVASLWLITRALERLQFDVQPHIVAAIDAYLRSLINEREQGIESMRSPEKNMTHRQNVLHGLLGLASLKWLRATSYTDNVSEIDEQIQRTHKVLKTAANSLQLPALIQDNGQQPFSVTMQRFEKVQSLNKMQWALAPLLAAFDQLDDSWSDVIPAEALFVLLDIKN